MPALSVPPRAAGYLTGLVCLAILGGCATTTAPKAPAPARIEVQEQVGFTIVEAGRISNDVRLDYDEALGLLRRSELQAGIAALEAVVTAAPYLMAPLIDLGIAYHQAGDLAAAERNLLLALQANPDHPIAHNELGIVYRKTGRFSDARQTTRPRSRSTPAITMRGEIWRFSATCTLRIWSVRSPITRRI